MATRPSKILVVEDDRDTRNMLSVSIRDHGYTVFSAVDRAEALAILNSHADITTVLLDYMMPGPSAFKFIEAMGLSHPSTRIILITAGDRIKVVARMLGIRDYLAKPIVADELLSALRPQH